MDTTTEKAQPIEPGTLIAVALLDGTDDYKPTGQYDTGTVLRRSFNGNDAPAALLVEWTDGTRCEVAESEVIVCATIDECPECGTGPWAGETPEILSAILLAHAESAHPEHGGDTGSLDAIVGVFR